MSQHAVLTELKHEREEIEALLQMIAQRIKANNARRNTLHSLRVELSRQLSEVDKHIHALEPQKDYRAVLLAA